MEGIKDVLERRKKYLLQIKEEKKKKIQMAPEGMLRVQKSNNTYQYYVRTDSKDCNGIYIKKKDREFAKKLAQRDYDEKVLVAVEKEIEEIEQCFFRKSSVCAEEIYESLHSGRQALVQPIVEPEMEYVRNWENVIYEGKGFDDDMPLLYTAKGERVRSKSEVIIADTLYRENIPYRYEYPLYLNGWGIVYPDFTVLNVRKRKVVYWEHFGRMDDPEYSEKVVSKIRKYEENNIFQGDMLLSTYETMNQPINQRQIKRMIYHFLQ